LSRKKYVRQVMIINDGATDPRREQSITFSPNHYENPHDDDPMVVTLQTFN